MEKSLREGGLKKLRDNLINGRGSLDGKVKIQYKISKQMDDYIRILAKSEGKRPSTKLEELILNEIELSSDQSSPALF